MAESIFTSQTPGVPNDSDGTTLTLGTRFVTAVDGTITAIRWFFPTTLPSGPVQGRLYLWTSDTTGTLLGSADFSAPVAGTWNTTAVSIPVVAGQRYVTAVRTPDRYVATAGLFNGTDIVNGNLSALRDDGATPDHNGKLLVGDGYPSASFGPGNGYLVDVVFEASSTSITGSVGQAHETDTAFAITAAFSATLGQAHETDSATAVSGSMIATLGTAVERDIAQGLSGGEVSGMPFVDAPCEPWPALWTGCSLPTGAATVTGNALSMASEVLWVMSGRRFSRCPVTLRPCREGCNDGSWFDTSNWWNWGAGYPQPRFFQGVWTNVACGQCLDGCSCSFVSRVRLPMPVASVTNVTVDGATLDPSAYRLYDYRDLVRQDGGEWPWCNDLSKPNGQPGTWSVTVEVGEPVPLLGQWAVAELATEFAKAMLCDASCQLPAPVQQISRQGVSMTFLDPNEVYANGRLGLRFVDMFLSTFNPDGLRAPARVWSVDHPIGRIPT